jgi:Na+/H+ antiporter NhaD/arsenite permease-like protein
MTKKIIINTYIRKRRKEFIALALIIIFAIIIFTVPYALGKRPNPMLLVSALVLVSVYLILSFEIVHRGSLALLGAIIIIAAAISFGTIKPENTFDFIIESIDFNTIGLLLGMMIIVAILGETGIFYWVGIKASKLSRGDPWKLMLLLCSFTAVASMFVDNVTTILLMVPVTLSIIRTLKIANPLPFILSQVLISNVGGAATLIGDPPNIMIGSAANIDFNPFLLHMGLTIAVLFGVSMLLFRFVFFRKDLKIALNQETQKSLTEMMERDENAIIIKDRTKLKKSLVVLAAVIILFTIQGLLHLEVSIIALGGAAVLLVITRAQLEKVLHEIDWSTLIFFTGLFIIVGTAQYSGLIKVLSNTAINITGGNPWLTFITTIWLSGVASAFVDNIPFTATMIPLIHTLNANPVIASAFSSYHFSPLWWALTLGADLGGNGTLIGSSAGVVAAGLSERLGHGITFNRWFK